MQAMNGSAVSFRKRGRLIGCCMALALALSALLFSASAGAAAPPPPTTYLALGDSISFGYTQEKFETHLSTGDKPAAFEEGFVNLFAKKLKALTAAGGESKFGFNLKGLKIVNDGCPGESTDSLLTTTYGGEGTTHSPLEDSFHVKKASPPYANPCFYHNEFGAYLGLGAYKLPLHHEYGYAKQPQVENGLQVLGEAEGKSEPTAAVTLAVGANDELALVKQCEREVKQEFTEFFQEKAEVELWESSGGTEGKEPPMEKTTPSKYTENPNATPKEALVGCTTGNAGQTIRKIVKNLATTIVTLHSELGGKYKGRIVLLGFYNPFAFVLEGSDQLQGILNQQIELLDGRLAIGCYGGGAEIVETSPGHFEEQCNGTPEESIIVKYANPLKTFNGTNKKAGQAQKEAEEQAKICQYTEMCNEHDIAANNKTEEAEGVEPSKVRNIGDIHPTPAGYAAMANLVYKAYKCPITTACSIK